jgi:hypothetical protein
MPETPPYLERVAGAGRYRFHSSDGNTYAVYDVVFRAGRHVRTQLGSRSAQSRIFRPADGMWRLYRFPDAEKRGPDVFDLERQLRAAMFYSPERFDASTHAPR